MKKDRTIGARLSGRAADMVDDLIDGDPATITDVIESAIAVLHLLRVSGMAEGAEDAQGGMIRGAPLRTLPAVLEPLNVQAQGAEDPTEQIRR